MPRPARSNLARLLALALLSAGCEAGPGLDDLPLSIPSDGDWQEVGPVLEVGAEGAWDHIFAGASSPSSVIQHEGRWLLFYVGAAGMRDDGEGPRDRAIGLAIASDGVRFEKVGDGPVVAHHPSDGQEEGANSAAVTATADGRLVMHYGAARQFKPGQIVADARVARSRDGLHFEDVGMALSHEDPSVHGYGDELFPLASYRHGGNWYVFYVPNGTAEARDLAVAWGPGELELGRSTLVVDGSREDPARAGGNVVLLDDLVLVFVQRGWKPRVRGEVRAAPAGSPWKLGPPLRIWDGPLFREGTKFFTVALDRERGTWLLYRLDWKGRIVLHTAPVLARDETPPTAPRHPVIARSDSGERLTWEAAHDPDTGIGQYRIRCGGEVVAEPIRLEWEGASSRASCAISAVNLHGVEGPAVALPSPEGRASR